MTDEIIRSSRSPSSLAAQHNVSRVCLILTTVLPIRDSEKVFTTGWRYSWHILSTLPILLFRILNESYTPWNYYFRE